VLPDRFKTSVTLLQAVRAGGAAIDWERFVLRYITLLKTWARRWGARPDLVDDVVQQTLLNVLRSMPAFEYDPKQSFRSWLKVVAWRSWRQIAKKQQDFPLLPGAPGAISFSHMEAISQAKSREDLLQMFDKMASAEIFDLACDRARPLFRESSWQAFEMMELKQRPGEEVAQTLGLTLPAVHAAVYRVRKKVALFASQLDAQE
jgi:RNA polymerase sigma-70 factor (ECF subfamily)